MAYPYLPLGTVLITELKKPVAKRQPWKSLQRHLPEYSYQEGYFGLVYIAIGQRAQT